MNLVWHKRLEGGLRPSEVKALFKQASKLGTVATLKRQKQENQKFKVILIYIASGDQPRLHETLS